MARHTGYLAFVIGVNDVPNVTADGSRGHCTQHVFMPGYGPTRRGSLFDGERQCSMEAKRFATLIRSLTAVSSRRRAVTTVLGGVLGGLAVDDEAEGRRRRSGAGTVRPRHFRSATTAPATRPGVYRRGHAMQFKQFKWVDLPERTGRLSQRHDPLQRSGLRTRSHHRALRQYQHQTGPLRRLWDRCGPGQTCCTGSCRALQTDPANCGACGTTCSTNQTCQAGVCVL